MSALAWLERQLQRAEIDHKAVVPVPTHRLRAALDEAADRAPDAGDLSNSGQEGRP